MYKDLRQRKYLLKGNTQIVKNETSKEENRRTQVYMQLMMETTRNKRNYTKQEDEKGKNGSSGLMNGTA